MELPACLSEIPGATGTVVMHACLWPSFRTPCVSVVKDACRRRLATSHPALTSCLLAFLASCVFRASCAAVKAVVPPQATAGGSPVVARGGSETIGQPSRKTETLPPHPCSNFSSQSPDSFGFNLFLVESRTETSHGKRPLSRQQGRLPGQQRIPLRAARDCHYLLPTVLSSMACYTCLQSPVQGALSELGTVGNRRRVR